MARLLRGQPSAPSPHCGAPRVPILESKEGVQERAKRDTPGELPLTRSLYVTAGTDRQSNIGFLPTGLRPWGIGISLSTGAPGAGGQFTVCNGE